MKSLPEVKLGLVIIWSNFGFIYPYLSPKYHFGTYLALLNYIYLYLAVFRLNYPYLGIFALNSPVPYSPYIYMHSSIETAPPCKILEQSDHYSSSANAVLCLSSHWQFLHVPCHALPLYTNFKQSDNCLCRGGSRKLWVGGLSLSKQGQSPWSRDEVPSGGWVSTMVYRWLYTYRIWRSKRTCLNKRTPLPMRKVKKMLKI